LHCPQEIHQQAWRFCYCHLPPSHAFKLLFYIKEGRRLGVLQKKYWEHIQHARLYQSGMTFPKASIEPVMFHDFLQRLLG
jgi:hypothetical protein